jgi:short-subunit dehydrogenase
MNPKIISWQDKRVWLIGASSGIGAALAQALAASGAQLALSARNTEKLKSLCIANSLILPFDTTQHSEIENAAQHLVAQWKSIDIVIYLAGDYVPMDLTHFDLTIAEQMFQVNFCGALRLTDVIRQHLRPGGGIAFVSSVAGYRGLPRSLAYGPGKAALIHLAECLHLELAPKKIGVWLVSPGFVATQLTDKNDFKMPALIHPNQAAQAILTGLRTGRFEIHFPKRFTRIMALLRLFPYRVYFPLIRFITGN